MKFKLFIVSLILVAGFGQVFAITATEILKKADNVRVVGNSFEMTIKVQTFKSNELDNSSTMKGYARDGDKSMVLFTKPNNMKGRKILMIGDNMWFIFPNTSKPVRVSPAQRLMGEVAIGDIARVNFSLDYDAEKDGEETVENKNCYRLKLEAKKNGKTYHKITYWVQKGIYRPIKAEFFARSGKMLKTAYYRGLKMVAGKNRPMKIYIYDNIKKNNYSIMEYINMRAKNVPSNYFNKEYLKRM